MDPKSIIRVYGNPENLPKSTPERPLVTFAIFAYNQERYIREAIEGAFSQTYSPLEIILSDDCSSDSTFEIMEEMAKEYKGLHRVVVRKGGSNVGTIDHLITVARLASGKYLIVAAGDDISYPIRTKEIVLNMSKHRAMAAFSNYDVIDEYGNLIEKNKHVEPKKDFETILSGFHAPRRYNGRILNIPGMSAAYLRSVVDNLPLTHARCLNEDSLMSFVVNLEGGVIVPINRPLMSYRLSDLGVSVSSRSSSIREIICDEKKLSKFQASSYKYYSYLEDIVKRRDYTKEKLFFDSIRKLKKLSYVQSIFYDLSVLERIHLLFKCLSPKMIDGKLLRYMIPRVLGVRVFSVIKYFSLKLNRPSKSTQNSARSS